MEEGEEEEEDEEEEGEEAGGNMKDQVSQRSLRVYDITGNSLQVATKPECKQQ